MLFKYNIIFSSWATVYTSGEMGDRLATTDMGQKLAVVPPLLGQGGAGSPSDTMWHGPRPNFVPSDIFIHPAVWPQ